jgi:hypothetical protein
MDQSLSKVHVLNEQMGELSHAQAVGCQGQKKAGLPIRSGLKKILFLLQSENAGSLIFCLRITKLINRECCKGVLGESWKHSSSAGPKKSRAAGAENELDSADFVDVSLSLLGPIPGTGLSAKPAHKIFHGLFLDRVHGVNFCVFAKLQKSFQSRPVAILCPQGEILDIGHIIQILGD